MFSRFVLFRLLFWRMLPWGLGRVQSKLMWIVFSNRVWPFLRYFLIPRLQTNVQIARYLISVKHDAWCIALDLKTTIKMCNIVNMLGWQRCLSVSTYTIPVNTTYNNKLHDLNSWSIVEQISLPRWFEPRSPGSKCQCATNELCWQSFLDS